MSIIAFAFIVSSIISQSLSELNSLSGSNTLHPSLTHDDKRLSILFLHSLYPAHFFPIVALGAELVSRGHRVTTLGPTIEGYEHLSTLAKSHGMEFISIDFIPHWIYESITQSAKQKDSANLLTTMYNLTHTLLNVSKDNGIFSVLKMKEFVDKTNGSNYDYIISDLPAIPVMYYIQRVWNTNNIMVIMTPVPIQPQYLIPWSYPRAYSPFTDNMSFLDRLLNTVIFTPLETAMFVLVGILSRLDENESFQNYAEIILKQPVLFNTVIGFDWPKTILPLVHYVGPMLISSPPPLKSDLVTWLSRLPTKAEIIYISMGTTGEVTKTMAEAFVKLSHEYFIVWSLRESNRNVLNNLSIDEDHMYMSSWISQLTMLKHSSIVLAIMHCGITSVQESLYNAVPVICFPSAYDQFDAALRLESQGLGIRLLSSQANVEKIMKAVTIVKTDRYKDQVWKMSRLLRAGGGAKKGADLVELYAAVGYDHGIPSFFRYKWSWIQYYNVDVWLVITLVGIIMIWGCTSILKCCLRKSS